ncbi:uncharacterized protein LOC105831795 isoform X5 [Monomorium pharaonis]|uniref:uncharacterized protein LOC105831795 isoform X5 n=1 Tax=Monomorium pharaonis TaxID=307658 RepID=UPI00174668A1|nr:uncharacterized protein LOC105831795 isoform X5 [Monomorium pharaonis]
MEEIYVPVHDNSSSIERTLRLMSYTSWFMGVGIAHPLKCPKFVTIIIRIIHLVICTVILIKHLQFVSSFVYFKSNTSVNKWFFAMGNMIYCVSTYYSIYHGIRQYEWPELMDKMKQLDRKIRRDVHMNDQPVRYRTTNKMLGHLDKLSDAPLIALKIRRIRELHNDICDLVIMINDIHGLHLLLCSTNSLFMVTSTLYSAYLNTMKEEYDDMLIDYMTAIIYTMQFGLICWICTLACQEFGKIKIIMNTIALKCKSMNFDKLNETRNQSSLETRSPLQDSDSEQNSNWSNSHDWNYVVMENLLSKILDRDYVSDEINWFLIQLQQRRVSFTACDFFEMSNNLFCSVSTIFTSYNLCKINYFQIALNMFQSH